MICHSPSRLIVQFLPTTYAIGKNLEHTASDLSANLDSASAWARTWGMLFNASKSEHLVIQHRNGASVPASVSMESIIIPRVDTHKHLGLTVNSSLSWKDHISSVYTTCARQVGILRRLRHKLHPNVFKTIYTGAIQPKLEYACAIWGGGPTGKLIKLQEGFCRRHGIHLPPFQRRVDYHTLLLFFKMKIRSTPHYLSSLIPLSTASLSGYSLRKTSFPVPVVSRKSTLSSFLPRAIILWNALPSTIHSTHTLFLFKKLLKEHLGLD